MFSQTWDLLLAGRVNYCENIYWQQLLCCSCFPYTHVRTHTETHTRLLISLTSSGKHATLSGLWGRPTRSLKVGQRSMTISRKEKAGQKRSERIHKQLRLILERAMFRSSQIGSRDTAGKKSDIRKTNEIACHWVWSFQKQVNYFSQTVFFF